MLDNTRLGVLRTAAKLCAASLGAQTTILDHTLCAIETFSKDEPPVESICDLIKAGPDGAARCIADRRRGARRAVQLGGCYFYPCHAELVEAILPFELDGAIFAYLLTGPFFLAPTDALLKGKIVEKLSPFHIPAKTIGEKIELIPVVAGDPLRSSMNLLSELVSASLGGQQIAPAEYNAAETSQEVTLAHATRAHARARARRAGDSLVKQQFVIARARLGNVAEMRQEIHEVTLRRAQRRPTADIVRTAVLETVSALWRSALEKDDRAVRIDPGNLAFSELFDARNITDILDWATRTARRIGCDSGVIPRDARLLLRKVQTYTRGRLGGKLSCAELAEAMGADPRKLDRMFQRHLGMSCRQYITMERLTAARRLLRESELTASAIAARTGFSDQSNFTKLFVNVEGITPIEYRTWSVWAAKVLQKR